ncbi:addiction module toxin, HicA family [Aurantimonas aggregata]|uniref:Addiction module toxin, HicA family n=1 Tax=Aurantimonas aggregata TaxID=2047720 RepID=A0A6L9MEC4_9HYPH|nr:type II toxin-antitoxin system HicA family toxin [Aurantimonas aggregata]NDV86189.1 addiction module toxin, HicA family [Aurantimonas aggregata]
MDSRAILSVLLADGWREIRRRGSHVQLKHPTKSGLVTLPHPKRDLPLGTLRSIEKQAGLSLRKSR